uniref:Dynein light chain n=1 Tax=Arion vulgaris TaxID=1028688 RepID=A0A0B7B8S5_9EUPU
MYHVWKMLFRQIVRTSKKNTHQLCPKTTFNPHKAKDIAEKVVDKWIAKDKVYSAEWARTTAKVIAGEVENLVKKLEHDRYKFVVQVFIGQKRRQGVECCSRFLADGKTDSFSEFTFQNDTLWCVVLITAVYYE